MLKNFKDPHLRLLVKQFLRFLIVGGISFIVDFGLYTLLYRYGTPYIAASITSFIISVIVNYWLSRQYVFEIQPDVSILVEFILYLILNIVALGLNTLILFISVHHFSFNPLVGKLIATAIVLIFNFITRKLLLEKLGKLYQARRSHEN